MPEVVASKIPRPAEGAKLRRAERKKQRKTSLAGFSLPPLWSFVLFLVQQDEQEFQQFHTSPPKRPLPNCSLPRPVWSLPCESSTEAVSRLPPSRPFMLEPTARRGGGGGLPRSASPV
ncbi:hypothetical protein LX32DRAFT_405561 [Colletotrichum zoysiae]|uniref:Uncharacterized protein n=1 Tax=Colletotrichum zoysiae TaxID=1216348 RepID=A0AAD9HHG5_9PEZI|nr:hypothetical protein LX32DRAFT_405561 [Colletotrichum zoysiae]